ncbi:hypothetical protein NP493_466g05057 [Ridgeia piscesae]|uniref:Rho-GAP domain-containing protein n=1 Tax=Ridgeia piscesae TaxID=27915 RepID=A0AAD9NTC6_RIDPI|nr:hypothetical protein NP493_466g05057 [Ridgeia piscesae]
MATKTEECNDSKEFDAFFEEVKDIEKNTGEDEPDLHGSDEELSKLPDEGEEELSWLKDAGLEHLAKPLEEGTLLDDEDVTCGTAGLTEEQVAVVKKRVDTLNATIRKKQKGYHQKHSKVDVRAVFSTPLPQRESCPLSGSTGTSETTLRSEVCSMPATSASNRVVLRRKGRENIPRDRTTFLQDLNHGSPLVESPVARAPGVSALMHRESDVSMSFTIDQPISPRPGPKKGTKELPYYKDSKDTLGVTKVDQMSEKDRCMIRKLALIELTSLYEVHNIKYTRRKPKRRYKDNSVFGVPLQTLLDNDRKRHPDKHIKVPLIFSQLIQFLTKFALEEEGILRVPGSVTRIKSIREEIEDRFNCGKFSWDDMRPNDIAGLFKQFLRELPIPLLTFEYIDAFAQVGTIPDHKQQLTALILLVLLLPDVHRDTLKVPSSHSPTSTEHFL